MIDPAAKNIRSKLSKVDIAFIALHGGDGEDGTFQRTLERWKIAYTGSGPAGSKTAFDKVLSKRLFLRERIPTPDFKVAGPKNWKKVLGRFPTPFFVKPACQGSSVGAFSVEEFSKNAEKIKKAVTRYRILIAETKIIGREFTVGILGDSPLPVIELRPRRAFYDYRAKYTRGMTDYLVPAPISLRLSARLRKIALKTHRKLGLRDFSRVDIMMDKAGKIYVLEANSIPGLTALSLLPKAAKAKGISFETLCCELISFAETRRTNAMRRKHG